ncbi:MAG: spondin domain-containing protein [Acidobacteriota bacterium]|nr:spondin domain-containing protein [Acidobacteriota bacterium]
MRRHLSRVLSHTLFVLLAAAPALAQGTARYEVSITNLTRGQVITPPVVVAHDAGFQLFTPGMPAREGLRPLAEDGMTAALTAEIGSEPGVMAVAVGDGVILPGQTLAVEVETSSPWPQISVVGMLASSNDAFLGAAALPAPPPGIRGLGLSTALARHTAIAYDAGTEANTESCEEIPGPPCGSPGVRHEEGAEGFIAVHPGLHGGADLDPAALDWNNPVALIRIRRLP